MLKYQRLLEGFADDEKFKDMVPYVVKEAQTDNRRNVSMSVAEDDNEDGGAVAERENDKLQQRMKRKETKQLIPNLEK